MKKKLARQRRIMLAKIMSVFLLITIAVSGIYVYITYSGEMEILKNNCHNNYEKLIENTAYRVANIKAPDKNADHNNFDDTGLFDLKFGINQYCNENAEVIVNSSKDNEIARNENVFPADYTAILELTYEQRKSFAAENNTDIDNIFLSQTCEYKGLIDFKSFRESMTDEQYEEITSYLTAKNKDDFEHFELICTEFYGLVDINKETSLVKSKNNVVYEIYDNSDGSIDKNTEASEAGVISKSYNILHNDFSNVLIPKTVEVVRTNKNHDWYVQDEVISKYELTPEKITDYIFRITDQQRNVIDADFVLGRHNRQDLEQELEQAMSSDWVEFPSMEQPVFYEVEPFTYIFYEYENIYFEKASRYNNAIFRYFEKVNVLESCLNRIGITFLYTLIMFILVGILVWFMSWNTLKRQLELEQKRRNLTNSMAHDIKTPLFVISGNAENLLECAENDDEKYYARNIIEKVDSVNEFVHNMLDLSAIDNENFRLSRENVNFNELVQSVIDSCSDFMDASDIHVEFADDVTIYADRKLMECVVQNLFDNALKYTNNRASVSLRLDSGGFSISNSVDSFKGINLKKIWEPYNRQSYSSDKEGNGLGLSIVRSVLELHGYKYYAERVGNTLTFGFKF